MNSVRLHFGLSIITNLLLLALSAAQNDTDFVSNHRPCRVPGVENGLVRLPSDIVTDGGDLSVLQVGLRLLPGFVVQVSCNEGFEVPETAPLNGISVCALNGSWVPPIAPCEVSKLYSCRAPIRTNGTLTISKKLIEPWSLVPVGKELVLTCDDGYALSGPAFVRCSNLRTWSPSRLGYCTEVIHTTYRPVVEVPKVYVLELGEAVATGNSSLVSELINDKNADVNAIGYPRPSSCCWRGWRRTWAMSAFHLAAMCCQPDIMVNLLDHSANVNSQDNYGYTALIRASANGLNESVKLLLEKEAFVNASTEDGGYTALILAAANGHNETVSLLIEHGADVNAKYFNGFTALSLAAKGGYLAIVQQLLSAGADVNARDTTGFTALKLAARDDHVDIVKLLLENGAKRSGCYYRLCSVHFK